jgi:hypothetical protein
MSTRVAPDGENRWRFLDSSVWLAYCTDSVGRGVSLEATGGMWHVRQRAVGTGPSRQ